MNRAVLRIKRLNPDAMIPERHTPGSAGFDLRSIEDRLLKRGQMVLVSTGLAFEMDPEYEVQIRSRSGLALRGVVIANAPGTIDSDYRGEVKLVLANFGLADFKIKKFDRLAHGVLSALPEVRIDPVDELTQTSRGHGGFGSTGLGGCMRL